MNGLLPSDCKEERSSKNNDNVNSDDNDDSSPREESTKRVAVARHNYNAELIVKIVSALFGPCEGRRLLTGELSSDEASSIPHTRDVAPFLRALLIAQQYREAGDADPDDESEEEKISTSSNNNDNSTSGGNANTDPSSDSRIVRMNAITDQGMQRATIALKGMQSMNAVFGDPCPGTSKRLHVHYLVREEDKHNTDDPVSRAASSELLYMSFAEHERVVLQRRVTLYQEDSVLKRAAARAAAKKSQAQALLLDSDQPEIVQAPMDDDGDKNDSDDDDETTLMTARRMGRTQSISDFAEDCILDEMKPSASISILGGSQAWQEGPPSPASSALISSPPRKWRLRSATSEIMLPVVMPFLEVRERVQCREVCRLWRHIVRDWGVAVTIDNNDPSFPRFTRPFLRGILLHSYSSLQSLFLSGSEDLQQSDLHPSIPHLRKLRSLDVSRCIQLDDSTLHLLSQHVSDTLEVLYIKGLRNVTDDGVISIAKSCSKLKVLEVSYIPITDQAGMAIGEHLTNLRAVYMRDNYLLTNRSIDVITEKCTRLEQLTLWGCTRLQHLSFDQPDKFSAFTSGNLVLLNLWGCHSLKDDAAIALAGMSSTLRTLIVSECHRLTDAFVIALGQSVPQLSHLNLRYCKRLTDRGINSIAQNLQKLYSLDLSFCTRVTVDALFNLLEVRGKTLAELRIQSCRKLDIARHPNGLGGDGSAGRLILNALRSPSNESCLSVLDLRSCGGQPDPNKCYADNDPFVQGMASLQFEQKAPGYFARPARWNWEVERQLVEQFVSSYELLKVE